MGCGASHLPPQDVIVPASKYEARSMSTGEPTAIERRLDTALAQLVNLQKEHNSMANVLTELRLQMQSIDHRLGSIADRQVAPVATTPGVPSTHSHTHNYLNHNSQLPPQPVASPLGPPSGRSSRMVAPSSNRDKPRALSSIVPAQRTTRDATPPASTRSASGSPAVPRGSSLREKAPKAEWKHESRSFPIAADPKFSTLWASTSDTALPPRVQSSALILGWYTSPSHDVASWPEDQHESFLGSISSCTPTCFLWPADTCVVQNLSGTESSSTLCCIGLCDANLVFHVGKSPISSHDTFQAGRQAAIRAIENIGPATAARDPDFCLVFCSKTAVTGVLEGLAAVLGHTIPAFGVPSASDACGMAAGKPVHGDEIAVALVWTSAQVVAQLVTGYQPGVRSGIVTSAAPDGSCIFEIDKQHASEVYSRWTGGNKNHTTEDLLMFPLGLMKGYDAVGSPALLPVEISAITQQGLKVQVPVFGGDEVYSLSGNVQSVLETQLQSLQEVMAPEVVAVLQTFPSHLCKVAQLDREYVTGQLVQAVRHVAANKTSCTVGLAFTTTQCGLTSTRHNDASTQMSSQLIFHAPVFQAKYGVEKAAPTTQVTLVWASIRHLDALWKDVPQVINAALDLVDVTYRTLLRYFGGYEVQNTGGQLVVAFSSARNAVQFSVELQLALNGLDWPQDLLQSQTLRTLPGGESEVFRGLRVAIAIHHATSGFECKSLNGRVRYTGPAVAIGMRMLETADAGQIVTTQPTLQELESQEWRGFEMTTDRLGSMVIWGVTHECFSVVAPDLRGRSAYFIPFNKLSPTPTSRLDTSRSHRTETTEGGAGNAGGGRLEATIAAQIANTKVGSGFAVASAFSTLGDTPDAAVWECMQKVAAQLLDVSPSFIWYYSTADVDAEALAKAFNEATPTECVKIGGTSLAGYMTEAGWHTSGGKNTLGVFAIADPKGIFATGIANLDGMDPREAGIAAVKNARETYQRLRKDNHSASDTPLSCVWMVQPFARAETYIIEGIKAEMRGKPIIAGGSTCNNETTDPGYQWCNGTVYRNYVVVVLMYCSAKVSHIFDHGFSPTARTGTVTKAEGRTIIEIDGKSAMSVFNEWTGGIMQQHLGKEAVIFSEVGRMPFGKCIFKEKHSTKYLLIHPVACTVAGAISTIAEVAPGDVISLMTGTTNTTRVKLNCALKTLLNELPRVHGAFFNMCCSYYFHIPKEFPDIAANLARTLNQKPMLVGLTGGEQGVYSNGTASHGNLMYSGIIFSENVQSETGGEDMEWMYELYEQEQKAQKLSNIPPPACVCCMAVTNVEGAARILSRSDRAIIALDALAMMQDYLRQALRECGGYEVRTMNDKLTAAFHNTSSAVRWALDVQQGLLNLDWPHALTAFPECSTKCLSTFEMTFVEFLSSCGLSEFTGAFASNGITSFEQVFHLTVKQLTQMGLRRTHTQKLLKGIMRQSKSLLYRGLRVNVGLHFGASIIRDDDVTKRRDYHGTGVEIAELALQQAHNGVVVITEQVQSQLSAADGNPFVEAISSQSYGGEAVKLFSLLPPVLKERHSC
eukprot:TRINITY_DN6531_c0_g1_i1.p1 TRINITY_DN6531_c0_g1~~TRINITY_DN6531_c0_g1_i1.p1  ORF type:complete len:1558 (-),score=214.28 TRINITY_DN6531_c0_g1_i1:143-4795(-)